MTDPAGDAPTSPTTAPWSVGPASTVPPAPDPHRSHAAKGSPMRSIIEWAVIIAVALIGAVIIRTVLFQAFFIPSASMEPTLEIRDRILVNKLSYDLHSVHRGDIVVFKKSALRGIAESRIKDLVKRVVGLPGDTISTSTDGHVVIDGKQLTEPYIPSGMPTTRPDGGWDLPGCVPPSADACTIAPGHYFVMGDNRVNSEDSRVFGAIPGNQIVGRAFILIWPLQHLTFL